LRFVYSVGWYLNSDLLYRNCCDTLNCKYHEWWIGHWVKFEMSIKIAYWLPTVTKFIACKVHKIIVRVCVLWRVQFSLHYIKRNVVNNDYDDDNNNSNNDFKIITQCGLWVLQFSSDDKKCYELNASKICAYRNEHWFVVWETDETQAVQERPLATSC